MSVLRNIIILTGVLLFPLYFFVGQIMTVSGQSMQPGFRPDDQLIVEKVSLYWREPQHNEIVVLSEPESEGLVIKRVVGLHGDTVEMWIHQRLRPRRTFMPNWTGVGSPPCLTEQTVHPQGREPAPPSTPNATTLLKTDRATAYRCGSFHFCCQ